MEINPENAVFIVLSFEGPDVYSMAGGLGARITHLTQTLAGGGFQVHHFFIGDPQKEGLEKTWDGKLLLHRWCQWISRYHPIGVYDGEEGKLNDFNGSAPDFIVRQIAMPAVAEGRKVIILGEEWHTAEAMSRISDLLKDLGIRSRVIMFWNANNTYSFERINWPRLTGSATITTVSKYMKQIMMEMGINPVVITNGIQKDFLKPVDKKHVATLRKLLGSDLVLSKVARWHPDKGWSSAIRAVDRLKRNGRKCVLLARGSREAYGNRVAYEAKTLDLVMKDIVLKGDPKELYNNALLEGDFSPYFEAMSGNGQGDILNLTFPVPYNFLQAVYKASDMVLANSSHEPFGLVGLEAMATGAVVFTGCSGEDYATHMNNAIVLDSFSPEEIEHYILHLQEHPERRTIISRAARRTAEKWIWEEVVKDLICKLEYQSVLQGMVSRKGESDPVKESESDSF
ncbi:MAG: glycosyltransferase family 4 protein [Planctomycetota bacterium]